MTKKWLRWTPAVAVPAVIAGLVIAVPMSANASSDLPEKSASELLQFVQSSDVTSLSGTINQTSDLGVPDLSGLGSDGATSALELLTADHEARVYLSEGVGARVQVLDSMAERDLISNGTDVWLYDSEQKTAVHSSVPQYESGEPTLPETVPTPAELADRLLAAIDPTTTVAVGSNTAVAGRDAYELVLSPKSGDTLVGSVGIAVDAETGVPLSVAVTASGGTSPAFSVGFSSVSFETPDASLFAFTPPAGTEVTEKVVPERDAPAGDASGPGASGSDASGAEPTVTGEGWNAVVELPGGDTSLIDNPLLDQVMTATDSGHVLQTALVSVLVTDDGRVFAGAVPASALETAAQR
ncbi:outer membrane lipoprotein carrier protein LolA [Microbacteriaceae bacterium VKM Ac-2855]|nr:outer membrane lipoprotein carrier protein LolA [Microbacteriaceae bacterium VKM Ac-2855]